VNPLSSRELLDVWEAGLQQSATQRALALLAAACPEMSAETLTALSIGQRDSLLLSLREWAFGSRFSALVKCPDCGERLELDFEAADVREPARDANPETQSLRVDGYEVQFRLPSSADLAMSSGEEGLSEIRSRLIERCVTTARYQGEPAAIESLPPPVLSRLAEEMALADPQADTWMQMRCPACSRQTQAVFDIAAYFWNEIDVWARRLLHDVHCLARAYGWSEASILSLSPRRRQHYLEIVLA
jgi:hypothetical protein